MLRAFPVLLCIAHTRRARFTCFPTNFPAYSPTYFPDYLYPYPKQKQLKLHSHGSYAFPVLLYIVTYKALLRTIQGSFAYNSGLFCVHITNSFANHHTFPTVLWKWDTNHNLLRTHQRPILLSTTIFSLYSILKIYMCVSLYIYIHVNINISMYPCIHICIYTYVCGYVYIYIYIYI